MPLAGAREDEGAIRLAYDRATVDAAPDVDPDVALTEEEERVLHEHYGRQWAPPSGTETDTAMTRSEEEVEVGTRVRRSAERVRLRKVLVQDEVTTTVPVRKEVIRLETAYIREWSIWKDLAILLRTIPVVFTMRDAH